MTEKTIIFYGVDCGNTEALAFCKKHDIALSTYWFDNKEWPLIFTDPKDGDRLDLEAVFASSRPGTVVVMRALSDLGHGGKSKEMQDKIKAGGAEILVPEHIPQKRGPKPIDIPEEFYPWAKDLHDNQANSRAYVIMKIFEKTGVKFTRRTLERRFKDK